MLRAIGPIEKHMDIHRERERDRQIFVTPAQASANQSRSLLPWLLTREIPAPTLQESAACLRRPRLDLGIWRSETAL